MVTNPTGRSALEVKRSQSLGFWAIVEIFCPLLIGLAAGIVLLACNPPTSKIAPAVERLLNGSIDAAAVLAGFQTTALTLLLSIADKPIIKRLKAAGHYNRLISFHSQAIVALLFWLGSSMVMLAIQGGTLDKDGKCADLHEFTRWSTVVLVSGMAGATCASFRVMHLLVKVLRAAAGSEDVN